MKTMIAGDGSELKLEEALGTPEESHDSLDGSGVSGSLGTPEEQETAMESQMMGPEEEV